MLSNITGCEHIVEHDVPNKGIETASGLEDSWTQMNSIPAENVGAKSKSQSDAVDGVTTEPDLKRSFQIGKAGLPDGLLPLGLADLGLLVPLGHDLSQWGSSDGPLELNSTAGTLLCHLFLLKHDEDMSVYLWPTVTGFSVTLKVIVCLLTSKLTWYSFLKLNYALWFTWSCIV